MKLYIASYGKGKDKGIYIVDFNEDTRELSLVRHIPTNDYPSYIIRDNNQLYVSYKDAGTHSSGGGLGSYTIQGDTLILNNNLTTGKSYTHLALSSDKKYLFAANYHLGSTASYALDDTIITRKIMRVRHKGNGPDPLNRQEAPHVHYVGFTPDDKYLYAVDLGADKVVVYTYHNGTLKATDHDIHIKPGSGPRHMIFSKDGKFAYLVNEIANRIMVFSYQDGTFSMIQSIHCTPRHFKGFSAAAAIRLTDSGKHLMISNRGHDSIALYKVLDDGKIDLLYMVHNGKEPRDFNIINDKYLIISSQKDNKLQVMSFDEESERLLLTTSELKIPQPVCVCK